MEIFSKNIWHVCETLTEIRDAIQEMKMVLCLTFLKLMAIWNQEIRLHYCGVMWNCTLHPSIAKGETTLKFPLSIFERKVYLSKSSRTWIIPIYFSASIKTKEKSTPNNKKLINSLTGCCYKQNENRFEFVFEFSTFLLVYIFLFGLAIRWYWVVDLISPDTDGHGDLS